MVRALGIVDDEEHRSIRSEIEENSQVTNGNTPSKVYKKYMDGCCITMVVQNVSSNSDEILANFENNGWVWNG